MQRHQSVASRSNQAVSVQPNGLWEALLLWLIALPAPSAPLDTG